MYVRGIPAIYRDQILGSVVYGVENKIAVFYLEEGNLRKCFIFEIYGRFPAFIVLYFDYVIACRFCREIVIVGHVTLRFGIRFIRGIRNFDRENASDARPGIDRDFIGVDRYRKYVVALPNRKKLGVLLNLLFFVFTA